MDPIEAEAQPGVVMPGVVMPGVLAGGGEMGARMRAFDWSASPLGVPESWAQPLKTLVGVLLASKQAMFIGWGPRRIMLYNDSYAEILGLKHPGRSGSPLTRCGRRSGRRSSPSWPAATPASRYRWMRSR
ncbi:hypothetical protein [Roseomonas chloroacetimidivorans]|uniref:hypothetical protein n=1 Tax=Roseomonas chloroacetimidivorans TaxID=1766656 RepID=UPI003C77856A